MKLTGDVLLLSFVGILWQVPVCAQSTSCELWKQLADQANAGFNKLPGTSETYDIDFRNAAWSKCFVWQGVWVGCNVPATGDPSLKAEALGGEIKAFFPDSDLGPRETDSRRIGGQQVIKLPKRAQFQLLWGGDNNPHSVQWLMLNESGSKEPPPKPAPKVELDLPIFKCELVESSKREDKKGIAENKNYKTYSELYRLSETAFQVWSAAESKWSADYCQLTSNLEVIEKACFANQLGNALFVRFKGGYMDTLANDLGRYADLYMTTWYTYQFYLDNSGQLNVITKSSSETGGMRYYSLDKYGHKSRQDPNDIYHEPSDAWASKYKLEITGTGKCARLK